MRILVVNQSPARVGRKEIYDVEEVTRLLNSYASPGTRVEIGFPEDFEGSQVFSKLGGVNGLNGLHHMMEVPSIVRKIFWAAQNGYDAVISSNTFDPGVDGGRLAVDIPVIGLLRCSMHAATILADKVGVLVPLSPHVPYTRRLLRGYGMEHFASEIRPLGIYGEDMASRKDHILEEAVKVIREMVANGAEIIVPLGGALIPYVVNPDDLARETGVQVVNTKAIGIRFAETCVALGMSQSALTYPRAKLEYADFLGKEA
ncbi:aspartate/glutamate racemase family protein [Pseudochelatococcus sp. B33]